MDEVESRVRPPSPQKGTQATSLEVTGENHWPLLITKQAVPRHSEPNRMIVHVPSEGALTSILTLFS